MKTCKKCRSAKPLSEFSASRQGTKGPILRSDCKSCCSSRAKAWFAANKERNATTKRAWNLESNYGITVEVYDVMFERQGGVCAICNESQSQRLSVDHCHTTGRVRGLLCNNCNRAIGLLSDDVNRLKSAVNYLRKEQL